MDIIIDPPPRIDSLIPEVGERNFPIMDMLRLDLLDPEVGGNKLFKLQANIEYALGRGYEQLVSFGGPHSNHLLALAVAASQRKMPSIGLIRGKDWESKLTPTLRHCLDKGMALEFLHRDEFAQRSMNEYRDDESLLFNGRRSWVIPAGGSNALGRKGAEAIARYIPKTYTHILVPAGTGTTAIGLRNALDTRVWLGAYTPLKGGAKLRDEWVQDLDPEKREVFQVFDQGAGRGFGKPSAALLTFMNAFYERQGIPLDHVYTAKMMMTVKEQIKSGMFSRESRLLLIHTGGIQGNGPVRHQLVY